MKRIILMSIAATLLVASQVPSQANDLGALGETFPVAETDLLALLGEKLKTAMASGRGDRLNAEFAEASRRKIENPPAVQGVGPTKTPRTWLYDPSMVVPQDLADQQGRVFARAGNRINPLERLPSFNRVLVFLDGSNEAQVQYALHKARTLGATRTVLVLTSGAPVKLKRSRQTQFYFDQQGLLTSKFGITHVPAVVMREGNLLRIREVLP